MLIVLLVFSVFMGFWGFGVLGLSGKRELGEGVHDLKVREDAQEALPVL
jgi:hypothetical protein